MIVAVFGARLRLISAYGSPVPTYDQWESQARLLYIPFAEDRLKLRYFFVPHNEHRIVFTRLVNFCLTIANRQWDPRLEMTVNALLSAGLAGALVAFAARLAKGAWLLAPAAVILGAFIAPTAWENTLGGFQSQFYFLFWAALGHLWLCLGSEPLKGRRWAGYAVGLLGLFTMGSGLIAPATVLGVLVLNALLKRTLGGSELRAAGLLLLVCLAGVLLIHRVEIYSVLKPASAGSWLGALPTAFGWPLGGSLLGAACIQFPMIWLAASLVRRGRRAPVEGLEWALLALGIWCWISGDGSIA